MSTCSMADLERTKKLLNWYKKKYCETMAKCSQIEASLAYYKWKDSQPHE